MEEIEGDGGIRVVLRGGEQWRYSHGWLSGTSALWGRSVRVAERQRSFLPKGLSLQRRAVRDADLRSVFAGISTRQVGKVMALITEER